MAKLSLQENQRLADFLPELAEDIAQAIFAQDPEHSQELLGAFVSQLFMSATKQTIRQERHAKQAEGIAAAKARGVHFGSPRRELPDNFEQVRVSWRNREMNLKDAAKMCGLPPSTFYEAARRVEEDMQIDVESRSKKELPKNFEEARQAWRRREITLEGAAKLCGMPASTFYGRARKAEQEQKAS